MGLLDITSDRSAMPGAEEIAKLDLTDTSSKVDLVLGTSIASIIVISLIVSTRTYVRIVITGKLFTEDVLMIIAAVFAIVLLSTPIAAIHYGVGKHIWTLDLTNIQHDLQKIIQFLYVGHIFQQCTLLFTKLSILFLYRRLFPSRALRMVIYGVGIFCILYYLSAIFAVIFQCSPVSAAWTLDDPDPKCFDFIKFLYASAAVNIATDIIICVMPLGHFCRLQLPTQKKLVLCLLFVGGGAACIAAIMRITVLNNLYSLDFTYAICDSLVWSNIECTIAILCGSLPALRPLFTRIFPNIWGSSAAGGTAPAATKDLYVMSAMSRRTKPPTAVDDDLRPSLDAQHEETDDGRTTRGEKSVEDDLERGDSTEELTKREEMRGVR